MRRNQDGLTELARCCTANYGCSCQSGF